EEVNDELPALAQTRCSARLGWDREIRIFCRVRNIVYQGFSLLTANMHVLGHPAVTALAQQANVTPAQIVFAFARAAGMLPLTGTASADHMSQDLASREIALPPDVVREIEPIFG